MTMPKGLVIAHEELVAWPRIYKGVAAIETAVNMIDRIFGALRCPPLNFGRADRTRTVWLFQGISIE
jgi:hypothetical protein